MSRNAKPPVVMVLAKLLEPVQTATERHEPGTVVEWPQAEVDALVAAASAVVLTAEEAAAAQAEAPPEAPASGSLI